MTHDLLPSDHAFEAFLAGVGPESFTGEEATMYRFFRSHPGQRVYRAVEKAIQAYERGKR